MALEVNGKSVETSDDGYLADINAWDDDVALALAADEGIEMTDQHWDIVRFLRAEHVDNGGAEPNEREIMKAMKSIWGKKPTSKIMYQLFPTMPSKQGRKIAGLPKSTRKGGY